MFAVLGRASLKVPPAYLYMRRQQRTQRAAAAIWPPLLVASVNNRCSPVCALVDVRTPADLTELLYSAVPIVGIGGARA